jgi:hypothetical protein
VRSEYTQRKYPVEQVAQAQACKGQAIGPVDLVLGGGSQSHTVRGTAVSDHAT